MQPCASNTVQFQYQDDPNSWTTDSPVKAIKFNGNIACFLSDPHNVADLDAVLTGHALIIRINPKAT
jgi:hypothetical protein